MAGHGDAWSGGRKLGTRVWAGKLCRSSTWHALMRGKEMDAKELRIYGKEGGGGGGGGDRGIGKKST